MITVTVFFNFSTKEEWLEFGKKILNQKWIKSYTPIVEILQKKNKSYEEFVNSLFAPKQIDTDSILDDALLLLSCIFHITTKSEKVLRKLNEYVRESHYENNYQLRDNWGNKLYMSFDELFKWWKDNKK